MGMHYPRIRVQAPHSSLLFRDGLSLTFFMRRSHKEVAQQVKAALDIYLRTVGPTALGWYLDEEGEAQHLDETGWATIRRGLSDPSWAVIRLRDATAECRYRFEYYGKPLEEPSVADAPGAVCMVDFWLPTEYLEEHGPTRVRELALELAEPLPFCTGHAGLSFNGELDLMGAMRQVASYCFRFPGMDIPASSSLSWKIGTCVRGPHWLTFLGQPVLGQLNGVEGLRSLLPAPDTSVHAMSGGRALVTLGEWPKAGDIERGDTLPAYRELARILEPWFFYEADGGDPEFPPEAMRRWERRFLD
jgi:hypothetical protein